MEECARLWAQRKMQNSECRLGMRMLFGRSARLPEDGAEVCIIEETHANHEVLLSHFRELSAKFMCFASSCESMAAGWVVVLISRHLLGDGLRVWHFPVVLGRARKMCSQKCCRSTTFWYIHNFNLSRVSSPRLLVRAQTHNFLVRTSHSAQFTH